MNKDILIINQQHTSNLGDKAIGEALEQNFKKYSIEFMPYIPTEDYEDLETAPKCRKKVISKIINKFKLTTVFNDIKYYFKIRKLIKNKEYRLAIIGGGELISGNLEFNSAFCMWIKVLAAKKIPIVVAGVSGNIVSERIGKRYAKACSKCSSVYARDMHTKEIFKNKYDVEAKYCPDFVFSFKTIESKEKENLTTAQIYYYDYAAKKEGINNKEMYFDDWYFFIVQHTSDEEIILSYSDKDDKISTTEFRDYVLFKYGKEFKIQEISTLDDLIGLLKRTKKIISGRMHPMIMGLLNHNEIIPFITKKKIAEFEKEWKNKNSQDLVQARLQIEHMVMEIEQKYLL